jgi:putative FmdB family regulatory protein
MPIYEYYCPDCDVRFEARRSIAESDKPALCTNCQHAQAHRIVSSFAAHTGNGGASASSGSACGTCSTKHCSTCGTGG